MRQLCPVDENEKISSLVKLLPCSIQNKGKTTAFNSFLLSKMCD